MHRIDTAGNVGNQFVDPNPGAGQQGTVVDYNWLNAMQEELTHVVLATGGTLVKGTWTQVYDAILGAIGLQSATLAKSADLPFTANAMCSLGFARGGGAALVAVGPSGALYGGSYFSPVGLSSLGTPLGTDAIWDVASNGTGLVVCVGGNTAGKAASSPDGVTFTAHNPGGTNALLSVAYASGMTKWIATGAASACYTSPDGTTWTARTVTGSTNSLVVRTAPGLAMACETGGSGTPNYWTSTDGTTWTSRGAAPGPRDSGSRWFDYNPALGLWFFLTNTGRVYTSPDAITWTLRYTHAYLASSQFSIAFKGKLCLAVSADVSRTFAAMSSFDGINWAARCVTVREATPPSAVNNIACLDNGTFVLFGTADAHALWTAPFAIP